MKCLALSLTLQRCSKGTSHRIALGSVGQSSHHSGPAVSMVREMPGSRQAGSGPPPPQGMGAWPLPRHLLIYNGH